jgi:thiol-disulfide isomerase/thioredoxin
MNIENRRTINLVFMVLATVLASAPVQVFSKEEAVQVIRPDKVKEVAAKEEEYEQLEVTFTDADGKPRNLDEYRGKLILLNLWATWCAPCVKEMPALADLQREFGEKGLAVVTLSSDQNPELVKAFFEKHQIDNLPVYMDQNMKVFQMLESKGLPVTSLLGTDGNEIQRFAGYVDWTKPEIRKLITDNLPKKE